MIDNYILKGKTPVIERDLLKWARWMAENDPGIARDDIKEILISTVFLGFDHSLGTGDPILFETMIFGGRYDLYQRRYSTYEKAEEGHQAAVEMVKKSLLRVVNGGQE